MPLKTLSKFILIPELKLEHVAKAAGGSMCILVCSKAPKPEFCPKCATPSSSGYDSRVVTVKDAPIHGVMIKLRIRKRRLWCAPCKKPFTEPIPGIRKNFCHTERYGRALRHACDTYSDLARVRRDFRCSSGFLYKAYYRHLELRAKRKQYPWPKVIGIDEHAFKRNKTYGNTEFASLVVDYKNKRVLEVAEGKTQAALEEQLQHIPGRENVNWVTLDLCDPFKNFAKGFFPNANLVADKFHVIRLLTPAILKKRHEITGTRADLRARKLLLMSAKKLGYFERLTIERYLDQYPELKELYLAKEAIHRLYRMKGYHKAAFALTRICDAFALSKIKAIQTLRRTLMKWREEILNYFKTGLTNARVEGYNNVAKLVKKRSYGYRSFKNYRLRLLDVCS
jgi:transposase